MNVYIFATRNITFKKKDGKRSGDVQTITFDAMQTPTAVTREIVKSADPAQAYIDYIKSCSRPEQEPIYSPDDIFEEGPILGYNDYDWTVDHVQSFKDWLAEADDQGYSVKFETT